MRNTALILGSFGCLLAAAPVVAEAGRTPGDKVIAACKGATGDAQAACLERAVKGIDGTVAEARKTALATINGGALAGDKLKAALAAFDENEKSWEASRKTLCETYAIYGAAIEASDGAVARSTCLINEAANRIAVLKRLFSSE